MANLKSWIVAARLRTLPLAFSSILVGVSLSAVVTEVDYRIAGLTFLTAFLLQVLSNFANDYGDAVSGVDSAEREGPNRMVQSGAITKTSMRRGLIICALFTLISGLLLLYLAFPGNWSFILLFLIIGIASIIAAIKYTVGKNPYGYVGFGDIFVFIFFGVVAVVGTYFIQTKTLDWMVFLPASSLGLFAVGVLNVNNIRDIESDQRAGKYSIPVRIGKSKAIVYHGILLQLGLLLSLVYVILRPTSWLGYLFLLSNVMFIVNIKAVSRKPPSALDPYLKQMALATLLFAILFALGQFAS